MKTSTTEESRRNFLKTMIPAGGMICFGCPNLFSRNTALTNNQDQKFSERIQTEISLTHEDYFKNRFKYYVGIMEKFSDYMGREKLISMLKRAVDDQKLAGQPNLKAKSVKDFITPVLEDEIHNLRLDVEVLELTDNVCQVRVTNCLWTKTFRDMNAGDIGYATICHGDFSAATAFHPNLRMERTMTLMEGHECCDHRYIWES